MRTRRIVSVVTVLIALAMALVASGCGVQVYNFGGAGSGSKFVLPPGPAASPDPVVQSWVAYSLALSTCQLQMGGDLPSANTSFECEHSARRVLVDRWDERQDRAAVDPDLELLSRIRAGEFLDEYVWVYFRERSWQQPEGLDLEGFEHWRSTDLEWHRPKTRIIGYWMKPRPRP